MKSSSVLCKLLLWNVWSIANETKLNNYLQILEDMQINVACVTETWFNRKNGKFSKTIKDAGFKLHHAFREDKRGGGCAILYKKNLSIKKGEGSTVEFSSLEYISVTLSLKNGRKLLIVCLYRKQEVSFKIFHDELITLMNRLNKKGAALLVVGDFNIWIEDAECKDAEQLLQLMNSFGLIQNIQDPTHRSGHTLDHVYSNPYQIETQQTVLNDKHGLTTDHLPIIVQIPAGNVEDRSKTIYCRKLKDIDLSSFRQDLTDAIKDINTDQEFSQYSRQYDEHARGVVEKHAPLVSWTRKTGYPAWMDIEYRKNRTLRRKYERIWKRNQTPENMQKYIQQKAVCTEMAVTKQSTHYTKLVKKCGYLPEIFVQGC
jgi:hypothetical protein